MIRIVVATVVVSSSCLVIGLGVGCGGKVVFEDSLGSGGTGGLVSVATGSGASSSTSTGSSTGGASTGASSTSASSSSSSGSSSSSASTGAGGGAAVACVSNMDPGGQCTNCTDQALNGACFVVTEECVNDVACLNFSDCSSQCFGDQGCCQDCASLEPEGADLFGELVDCVVCQECGAACVGFFPGFSTCQ